MSTARRNTLILVGLLIVLTTLAVWTLGGLAIVFGLLALVVLLTTHAAMTVRREHRALMRRLGTRPLLPIDAQIDEFLRASGHTPTPELLRVISGRWREVAGLLAADPRLLRVTDSLESDYHSLGATSGDNISLDLFHSLISLCAIADGAAPPAALAPRCPFCRYDLSGLPGDSRCPECGRPILHIRTLGDYLLFIARLAPTEARAP